MVDISLSFSYSSLIPLNGLENEDFLPGPGGGGGGGVL